MCLSVSSPSADFGPASPSQPHGSPGSAASASFGHSWSISMTMGEMVTPRSPLQSDSEGSTSSLELGSGVAGIALNGTPPPSPASSEAVKCRWQHCGLWLANLDALALHVTLAHAAAGRGGLFYCGWEGCSRGHRGFNARYKMLVHVRTHTNERPHRCSQCDKSFSRAENLKIHARSHTGERPYTCPVPGCTKAYSNSSDRFKHTRTHAVDKPYVCKVEGCPKRYTDPSSLRKHVKTYRHFPSSASSTHSPVGSPAASDLDSPGSDPHGSPSPRGSPRGSPSPSSDEEASTRSAFRPVAPLVSPSALERLERPPLPGECRGIPIKKAISARVRAVRHHDLLAAGGSSNSARSWAGGSVWVGSSGTTSPDALSLSMSPSSSPSPSPSSSSGSAVAPADWLAHGSLPMYSSPMNSPSPPWPWGPMMSLWPMAAAAAFAPAHAHASQVHAQTTMPAMPLPMGLVDHGKHPTASAAQAAPLDLTMTRH
ncbi:zinc finger protein GLIS2-like [Thrips palmi]|uniref:Zinc finger protein GLIS2-like n=1 Tax=Thrips palmi TaxID=161013 RepID=A0A6P8ZJE9_THRPL|nr:zinc finger protein GLIS2-like [Thrips palmi]